jgi:signal transduction histidine kinase
MKRLSIVRRIILAVVACQLLLTAGVTAIAVFYARKQLRAAFDLSLQGRAASTLALVRYTESDPPGLLFDSSLLPRSSDPRHGDIFEILAADNHIVAESDGAEAILSDFASSDRLNTVLHIGSVPYRGVALRNVTVLDDEDTVRVPSRVTVIYAASFADMGRRLTELAFYVTGASFLLLLAAGALAAWLVRRGLAPLRELAVASDAISPNDWSFRPPAAAARTTELVPLVSAIETLLARLKESFRQQRDFTSDAAHELKTSVAIVKSTLQSLLHRPRTESEYLGGLEHLLEDCARLEDLLERMLRLARIEQWAEHRAEHASPDSTGITELSSTCETAMARMKALADAREITLELVGQSAVHLRADPEDLELIWTNLLENAIQYSPPASKVVMRVQGNGSGFTQVSIEDSGPGIPPTELPHIFERFHRGDPSRARSTGGFGLGLAISKTLVEAYGGRIEARNRHERGAEVCVELPAES